MIASRRPSVVLRVLSKAVTFGAVGEQAAFELGVHEQHTIGVRRLFCCQLLSQCADVS